MNIVVNGNAAQIEERTSIVALLSQFNVKSPMTIVEVNKNVVAKEDWEGAFLKEGDQVEIIQLMGGG